MQKVNPTITLVAYGAAASGKTYILRKVKSFLETEGFHITGPMEVHGEESIFKDQLKEAIYVRR